MAKKKTFRWRGMVTLFLLLVLLVDAVSGIILYFSPAGSIARWSNWTVWGLSKYQWSAIHIVFSLMLLLILAGHLYFNWRMLSHFIWDKMRQVVTLKKELAGAFTVAVFLFVGTLWGVQPLKAVTDLRETMKRSGSAGFAAGQVRGYSNRTTRLEDRQQSRGKNSPGNHSDSRQQTNGRGGGFGRNAYTGQLESKTAPSDASQLKGRDFVRLGKLETHSGTLTRINNDEWGLKTGDRVFEIHLGPSEYRASKGFILNEGASATVSGYAYENHLSVKTLESDGQSIALRDENGRAVWSGSTFSRGGGRAGASGMDRSDDHSKGRS
jgi:hypothetical protein